MTFKDTRHGDAGERASRRIELNTPFEKKSGKENRGKRGGEC